MVNLKFPSGSDVTDKMHPFRIVCSLVTTLNLLQYLAVGDAMTIPPQPFVEPIPCIDSAHTAEQVIASNPHNLDSIDNALYPVNSHPALVATVYFYFNTTKHNSSLPKHPSTFAGQQLNVTPDYTFQWISAPIFLPLGMEVMEVFGMVFISVSKHEAHIALSPLCKNSAVEILSEITTKLQLFSSTNSGKERGFAVQMIPQNNGSSACRYIPVGKEDTSSMNHWFLYFMMILPLMLSFSLALITSSLIHRQLLIPTPSQLIRDSNQLQVSIFLGLLVVCFIGSLFLAAYQLLVFIIPGRKIWKLYILVPVPVILPLLLVFDIAMGVLAMIRMENLHKLKDRTLSSQQPLLFKVVTMIGSTVITIFLQMVSFHVHWFVLMLVNFPMEVGSICVAYIALFCSALFIVSGFVHFLIFGCNCGSTSRLRANDLYGTGFLFFAVFILSLVYSMTVIIGGVNYHDGMSQLMPNFLPYIIIGFSLWFFKKSKLTEKPPGAEEEEQFLEEKLKLLSESMKLSSSDENTKLLCNEEA